MNAWFAVWTFWGASSKLVGSCAKTPQSADILLDLYALLRNVRKAIAWPRKDVADKESLGKRIVTRVSAASTRVYIYIYISISVDLSIKLIDWMWDRSFCGCIPIGTWARSFILIGMWNWLSSGLICRIPDRYVVSPVASWSVRGLTYGGNRCKS